MKKLDSLLYIIPCVVLFLEYLAVSSALAYARFAVDVEQNIVELVGGIIKVGGNLPFDAVPNLVVTLHLVSLFLSILYLVYFFVFVKSSKDVETPIPPQEG